MSITVKITEGAMRSKELASRIFTGEVKRISAKGAVLFAGSVLLAPSQTCHRCSKKITHPASRQIGYGPDCAAHLGLEWAVAENRELSELELASARQQTAHLRQMEMWFAPSQIKQLHEDGTLTPIAEAATGEVRVPEEFRAWLEDGTGDGAPSIMLVKTPYSDENRAKHHMLRGWWLPERKAHRYPGKKSALLQIITHFPGIALDDKLAAALAKHQAQMVLSLRARADALPPIPNIKTEARWYQKLAFEWVQSQDYPFLNMKMGHGKTLVALAKIANSTARRVIVFCPRAVVAVWPGEVRKHLGDGYRVLPLNNKAGTVKERAVLLMAACADPDPRPLIVVVNYEAAIQPPLGRLYAEDGETIKEHGLLEQIRWDIKIMDESHKLIKPSGVISRYIAAIKTPCAIDMTGTPMKKGMLDWYGQLRALKSGLIGFWSYKDFRNHYAIVDESKGYPEIVEYRNMEELHARLAQIVFQVQGVDLGLPATQMLDRIVELGDRGRTFYNTMVADAAAYLDGIQDDDHAVIAKNKLGVMLHCSRATGGWVKTATGREEYVDDAKADALREILDDLADDEPVVIAYRFDLERKTITGILKELEIPYLELYGGKDQWEDFRDGKARVLVVQVQAGNAGIDLTQCGAKGVGYMILWSVGFGLIDWQQLLARVNRSGQTVPVTYIRIMGLDTIDEYVYRVLAEKADLIERGQMDIAEAQQQIESGIAQYIREHAA